MSQNMSKRLVALQFIFKGLLITQLSLSLCFIFFFFINVSQYVALTGYINVSQSGNFFFVVSVSLQSHKN